MSEVAINNKVKLKWSEELVFNDLFLHDKPSRKAFKIVDILPNFAKTVVEGKHNGNASPDPPFSSL